MDLALRKLDPVSDLSLYKRAWDWDNDDVPGWYAQAERIFGNHSWEDYCKSIHSGLQFEVGVFVGEAFVGLITNTRRAPYVWETFIAAPRHSDAETLTFACFALACDLFDAGVSHCFISWVNIRHRGAIRLNERCGMIPDGVTMVRGGYRGRLLEWRRYLLTKARMREIRDVQKIQTTTADDFGEHVWADRAPGHAGYYRGAGI